MADPKAERVWPPSTHTVIALSILVLFAAQTIAPYIFPIPAEGQAPTLIVSASKVVENVFLLVIGYYFGSTQESKKKTDAIADAVAGGRPEQ